MSTKSNDLPTRGQLRALIFGNVHDIHAKIDELIAAGASGLILFATYPTEDIRGVCTRTAGSITVEGVAMASIAMQNFALNHMFREE